MTCLHKLLAYLIVATAAATGAAASGTPPAGPPLQPTAPPVHQVERQNEGYESYCSYLSSNKETPVGDLAAACSSLGLIGAGVTLNTTPATPTNAASSTSTETGGSAGESSPTAAYSSPQASDINTTDSGSAYSSPPAVNTNTANSGSAISTGASSAAKSSGSNSSSTPGGGNSSAGSNSGAKSTTLSTGAIAGIAVGGAAVVVAGIAVLLFRHCRKRRHKSSGPQPMQSGGIVEDGDYKEPIPVPQPLPAGYGSPEAAIDPQAHLYGQPPSAAAGQQLMYTFGPNGDRQPLPPQAGKAPYIKEGPQTAAMDPNAPIHNADKFAAPTTMNPGAPFLTATATGSTAAPPYAPASGPISPSTTGGQMQTSTYPMPMQSSPPPTKVDANSPAPSSSAPAPAPAKFVYQPPGSMGPFASTSTMPMAAAPGAYSKTWGKE